MAGGINTTLVFHPANTDLSDIEIDMALDDSFTSGYCVPSGSIRFNEDRRIEVVYGEGAGGLDRGEVSGWRGVPVDIVFDVVVSDTTPAGKAEKASALMDVVLDDMGGWLEYKPDGFGASVLSTFYEYLKSPPPRTKDRRENRWDSAGVGNDAQRVYRIELEVRLRTQPVGISDPDSPVQVLSPATVYSIGDGSQDFVTIPASSIKGSLPALARIQITPGAGGASAIGSFYMAKRSKGLTNFEATYLTATYLAPTGVWSTQTISGRCDGSVYRCDADTNKEVYGIRYNIANWRDHIGRAAIMIVAKHAGDTPDEWHFWYRWAVGTAVVTGKRKTLARAGNWQFLLLGELDIPPAEMGDSEDLDMYIDVMVERQKGGSVLWIDVLKLFYVDQAVLRVDTPAGVGAENTHRFLVENFKEEIAHVIVSATSKVQYLCNAYGHFFTLDHNRNNRIDVAWERYILEAQSDGFSAYDGNWVQLARCDDVEDWVGGSYTENMHESAIHEGDGVIAFDSLSLNDSVELYLSENLDRFLDTDKFSCVARFDASGTVTSLVVRFILHTNEDTDYYYHDETFTTGVGETRFIKVNKSAFLSSGSPTWEHIGMIEARIQGGSGLANLTSLTVDDWRFERADPTVTTRINPTGGNWDAGPGNWKIHPFEDDERMLVSAVTTSGSRNYIYLDDAWSGDYLIRVRVRKNPNGGSADAGIVFRMTDITAGSEDGYMLTWTGSNLLLRELTNGTPATLKGGVIPTYTDWLWLGLRVVSGTAYQGYCSESLEDLFHPSNIVTYAVDATHSGTTVGLYANDEGLIQFRDFRIEPHKDTHYALDTASMQAHAIFRTIYPFHEA